jgi:hypothetical protein
MKILIEIATILKLRKIYAFKTLELLAELFKALIYQFQNPIKIFLEIFQLRPFGKYIPNYLSHCCFIFLSVNPADI